MSVLSDNDVIPPMDTDDSEATNAVSKVPLEGNGMKQQRTSQQHRGPMFTAIEDLLVAKTYIKASENAIIGNKQKLAVFYMQLATLYGTVKKEQEEEEKQEAEKPSHLRVPQLISQVTYPNWTGSSIYQHFNKKILVAVIKYMGVVWHVSVFIYTLGDL